MSRGLVGLEGLAVMMTSHQTLAGDIAAGCLWKKVHMGPWQIPWPPPAAPWVLLWHNGTATPPRTHSPAQLLCQAITAPVGVAVMSPNHTAFVPSSAPRKPRRQYRDLQCTTPQHWPNLPNVAFCTACCALRWCIARAGITNTEAAAWPLVLVSRQCRGALGVLLCESS